MFINILSCHIHSTSLYSYCRQSGTNDDESCAQWWMEALIFLYTIQVGRHTSVMIRETIIQSVFVARNTGRQSCSAVTVLNLPGFRFQVSTVEKLSFLNKRYQMCVFLLSRLLRFSSNLKQNNISSFQIQGPGQFI